jgi:hypothetical protein
MRGDDLAGHAWNVMDQIFEHDRNAQTGPPAIFAQP